ncbi:hypothetical protein AB6A40_004186 [Gnathostoma spinigerum]|uniref:protein xylosyltransferase n=1 Tax=Gnathostoma spinigerum TaxID=75299 RepID=A0ABD6EL90_9BILA
MGEVLMRQSSVLKCFAVLVLSFFTLNVILLLKLTDFQDIMSRILQVDTENKENILRTKDFDEWLCVMNDSQVVNVIRRMKTEECKKAAIHLACAAKKKVLTVNELTNSCPFFDIASKGLYVGCFANVDSSSSLSIPSYNFGKNSSNRCIAACLRAGFVYAGIDCQHNCFCIDSYNESRPAEERNCQLFDCSKNGPNRKSLEKCGEVEAVSIYGTGVKAKPVLTVKYVQQNQTHSDDHQVQILFLLQLNGRNIRQVKQLLRVIYSSRHLYIIHVDKRQDFMYSSLKDVLSGFRPHTRNIHLISERFGTIWGASSLLSMVFHAVNLTSVMDNWDSWDFVINLSESDFPVLPLEELEFHLARNKGLIFLSSHGHDTARFIKKQGLEFLFFECEHRMWRLGKRDRFPENIRIDGGSDWFVLSEKFARYAASEAELPKELRKIFSNVILPVETFFHTLAANSEYCNRVVKGNLRLTNWKRKQGCRCAMLRKVVDWCGCSPLVFTISDAYKYSTMVSERKPIFFARKFESIISQSAISIAESQVMRLRSDHIDVQHSSYNRTWLNFYDSKFEHSELLTRWSFMLPNASKIEVLSDHCKPLRLLSMTAYKENDTADIHFIPEVEYECTNYLRTAIQFLVHFRGKSDITRFLFADGYQLEDIRWGSQIDLKEEIFRNYASIVSVVRFFPDVSWFTIN